jgi:SAM-dependent methyltransferase
MQKASIFRLYWFCKTQLGIDPRAALRTLRGLPRFLLDLYRFRARCDEPLSWLPCLQDRYEEGGLVKNEYFWQDLVVARKIFAARPERHVDVGSRIDGFVAHVASFREIEVFDVRPISKKIPGMLFRQADLMNPLPSLDDYCDSLSCLHALEHFGLGRYGDPLDHRGHEKGIACMARLLKPGGLFYLSVPLGTRRVEFNANRVFDPRDVLSLAARSSLSLLSITTFHPDGTSVNYRRDDAPFGELAAGSYTLGLFIFIKGLIIGGTDDTASITAKPQSGDENRSTSS